MKSIKNKISFSMLLLTVVLLLCSSIGSYFISRNILVNQYSDKMITESQKYSEIVNGWLDKESTIFKDIVINMNDNNIIGDNNKSLEYLEQKLKSNSSISDLYIGLPDKTILDGAGWVPPLDYDVTKRDWYKNAVSKNGMVYVPYYDMTTKSMVVSISMPISKNGKFIGVISEDIKLNSITDMIQKAKPVQNSYGYLIDDRNNVLVHPYKDFKPEKDKIKNLNDFMNGKYKDIGAKDGQLIEMKDYDGINKYFSTSKVNISNWVVGFAVPTSEFTKELHSLIVLSLIILIVCIAASIIFSRYIAAIISKPINNMRYVIGQIGKLNFKYDENKLNSVIKNQDELGVMAGDIKSLSEILTNVVLDIKNNSRDILDYSSNILYELSESSKSIHEISRTAEEMASGSVVQASESAKSTEKLNNLSDEIKDVNCNANKFKEYFSNAKNINNNGIMSIKLLNVKLNENNEAAVEASRSMESLVEKSKSIGEIVEEVEAVSEETNLLALNAAIEAARAGEAGRGFSVVAEQVRLLSEETKDSVDKISKVIKEIQDQIQIALQSVENALKSNNEANQSMKQSNDSFNIIKESMDKMISNVDRLVQKINNVYTNKNLVIKSIENIAAISEESSAGSQELAASVEEQNNSIEGIDENMRKLKDISGKLDEIVSKFKLND